MATITPSKSMAMHTELVGVLESHPDGQDRDLEEKPIGGGLSLAYTDRAAAESRLVRKLDLYIMPLFFYLYMLCFLDRTNIGNAKVAGLEKDLHLTGYKYNIGLSIFYICYALVEVPSNLVLRKVGAQIWIPTIIVTFGVITTLTALIHNFGHLMAVRVTLGIAEGGLMPAYLVVLSRFYTRSELVLRTALFASSACIAGMFGGALAYGFLQTHIAFAPSWRAIFFCEGIISIGSGLLAYTAVPSEPATARFLKPEERLLAVERIRREHVGSKVVVEATKGKLLLKGFTNLNTIGCAIGFALSSLSLQGLALFVPTIIKAIDPTFTTLETQVKTIPVYAVAFFVAILFSWASSRYDRRAYCIIAVNILAIVGFAILLATPLTATKTRYGAVFLSVAGIYTPGPIWLSFGIANAGLDQMRAVAAGVLVGMGTLGSIVASWSYLPKDAPKYVIGNALNIAAVVASQILAFLLMVRARRENRLRDAGGRDAIIEGKTQEEIDELGVDHPEFRYRW